MEVLLWLVITLSLLALLFAALFSVALLIYGLAHLIAFLLVKITRRARHPRHSAN